MNILRIDSSAKASGSTTQALLDRIEEKVGRATTRRDLGAKAVPQIDGTWVSANFTEAQARDDAQKSALSLSDELVSELQDADLILIALPIYNFTVPGALKAWIDLVCRAGVTFKYTETGPVGLLESAPSWPSPPAARQSGPRSTSPPDTCATSSASSASRTCLSFPPISKGRKVRPP